MMLDWHRKSIGFAFMLLVMPLCMGCDNKSTVYLKGNVFHAKGCPKLGDDAGPGYALSDVLAEGYEPCLDCLAATVLKPHKLSAEEQKKYANVTSLYEYNGVAMWHASVINEGKATLEDHRGILDDAGGSESLLDARRYDVTTAQGRLALVRASVDAVGYQHARDLGWVFFNPAGKAQYIWP